MDDKTLKLIEAAEAHAESYNDDPRDCIKADVINAFYVGAKWMSAQAPAAVTHTVEKDFAHFLSYSYRSDEPEYKKAELLEAFKGAWETAAAGVTEGWQRWLLGYAHKIASAYQIYTDPSHRPCGDRSHVERNEAAVVGFVAGLLAAAPQPQGASVDERAERELPELPRAWIHDVRDGIEDIPLYSDDQMRDYARAALSATGPKAKRFNDLKPETIAAIKHAAASREQVADTPEGPVFISYGDAEERWASDMVADDEPEQQLAARQQGAAGDVVAWLVDWPAEPELGHYISSGPVNKPTFRCRALVVADVPAPAADCAGLVEALKLIAKYPEYRGEEMSTATMRKIARDALAGLQGAKGGAERG